MGASPAAGGLPPVPTADQISVKIPLDFRLRITERKKNAQALFSFIAKYFAQQTYTFWKVENQGFRLHKLSSKSIEGARRTRSKRAGNSSRTCLHKGSLDYNEQRNYDKEHWSWEIVWTFLPRSPSSVYGFCWKLVQSKGLRFYFSKSIGLLGEIFLYNADKWAFCFFLPNERIQGDPESPMGSSL